MRLIEQGPQLISAVEAVWGMSSSTPSPSIPGGGALWLWVLTAAILSAAAAGVVYAVMRRRERRLADCLADLAAAAEHGNEDRDLAVRASVGEPFDSILTSLARRLSDAVAGTAEREQLHTALEIKYGRLTAELAGLKSVLDVVPDPILICDAAQNLSFANQPARRLFAMDSDSAEGRALGTILRAESLWELLSAMLRRKNAPEQGASWECETPDGTRRSFQIHLYRSSLQGDPTGTGEEKSFHVIVFRDMAALGDLRRRHAEFVSSVSHEMKTPLSAIRAYVELLADGDAADEGTRDEFLAIIDAQTTRLQRLIENLLNLARIEAGIIKVNKEPRSLNDLLEEAATVVEPQAGLKQITLRRELSPLYLPVLADKDLLLQAAINLLSNAVKYTPNGGTVTLRSRLADDGVLFEVADTGVGLAPEDCQRIFERFYRVDRNKDMASGTGLGLPLAKHIVEDVHRGKMSVASRLGEGSTFSVLLPRASHQTVSAAG
ncbi:MAG: hypothetical protein GYA33_13895 [Thermogutta sp.]|nr:hypothetical protein [Thermogutta sp.]